MAYFTDTDKYTNVFTAGNVDIALTANDTVVDPTVDILGETDQYVYPGQVVPNKVAITNIGTEDAYVAAIITLSTTSDKGVIGDILGVTAGDKQIPAAINQFLTDLVGEADGYKVTVVAENNAEGKAIEYKIYIIKTAFLNGKRSATNNNSAVTGATLFTTVTFPTTWDNAQMACVNGLHMDVKAYATQTVGTGFENAESAIKTAFPDVFGNIVFPNNP